MEQSQRNYKRIVIKVGGSIFVDSAAIENIIGQIAGLVRDKIETIVVSSGAIACGMSVLKLEKRPKDVSTLQAVAALGQNELMNIYRRGLGKYGLNCGQVLLTWEDFDSRQRYLNARNTIRRLIGFGVVPVINENDTVSTDEIKFGDNDKLSALVSHLTEADLLIILSDVDGLLTKDKKDVVRVVEEITPQIKDLVCAADKQRSVGGMSSKLEAARIVMDSGLPCVIANGLKKEIIFSVLKSPQEFGTLFLSKTDRLVAKKRWIAFGTKATGKIFVDKGARQALVENNKSLLCPGIKQVEGDFAAGDTVLVVDEDNLEFARGKVEYSASELRKIIGQRLKKEVIHRDNLVIICRDR